MFCVLNDVVGTQKNRLNETVLLSTQNMLKLIGKKIFTTLRPIILFSYSCMFTHKIMNLFTFSPNMKNGEGNLISLLLQLTEDLWTKAALLSMVKTFLFSLW